MPTQVLQNCPRRVAEMKAITSEAASGVSEAPPMNCAARRGAAPRASRR
ncbi:MAG: hypothetical protein WKG00_19605 [Polyangiaceae bacterium]